MVSAALGTPRKVKDMVTYFENRGDHTAEKASSRRRRSLTAMMNFTRRPWEHIPRRKSSSSTNPRRRSSTSTGSESTTYELAEEHLAESFYAASERSGTSTVISEDRRRSENPDYDWEHDGDHDEIADLKARLNSISLWSPPFDTQLKENDTANELQRVDSLGVEHRAVVTAQPAAPPGVHGIDFVERSAPQAAEDESTSRSNIEATPTHHQTVNGIEVSHSETVQDGSSEVEAVAKPAAALNSKVLEDGGTPKLPTGAKIPARTSSATARRNTRQLRLKITQPDKDQKSGEATSPNSPSPKSKTRPKLALDLPGIPESEAETLGRQRRPSLSILQRPQAVHVNRSSRPPVSMRRYPMRSISAPLPGQQPVPPSQIMDLVNSRQVKFTNIREERIRRLSSINASRGTSGSQGVMGRRHASAPVSEAPRRRKPSGYPAGRPSLAQRFSLSRRKQSVSQAIRDYIRAPRRRPSFFFRRSRSVVA